MVKSIYFIGGKIHGTLKKSPKLATNNISICGDLTFRHSKQALYNRLFRAYQPKQLGLLEFSEIVVNKVLKNLMAAGNENARLLYQRYNKTINFDDLKQDVILYLLENTNKWYINNNQFFVVDDDIEFFKSVFGVVSKKLYSMLNKHEKHLYIELDNELVNINNIAALSKHTNFSNIITNVDYQKVIKKLDSTTVRWLEYRCLGYSLRNIANIMDISFKKSQVIQLKVRRALNSDYKQEKTTTPIIKKATKIIVPATHKPFKEYPQKAVKKSYTIRLDNNARFNNDLCDINNIRRCITYNNTFNSELVKVINLYNNGLWFRVGLVNAIKYLHKKYNNIDITDRAAWRVYTDYMDKNNK